MGGHASKEDMSYRRKCLAGVYIFMMVYLIGGYVLQENWSCLRLCLIGGHVLQKNMSYRRTGYTEGYIL